MTIGTVGIMSPGDMGHAIGAVLNRNGLRVVAALDERSRRSRRLAAQAGIADIGAVERLVAEADVILSVLVPARALTAAQRVAAALQTTNHRPLYVDCNAIAPATAARVGETITAAGSRFVDAAIIGPPPRAAGTTRIFASGEAAAELEQLVAYGLDMRIVGPEIGQASGLKMCYAALTKGLTALATELLVAAERLGLSDPLRAELRQSQPRLLEWVGRSLPAMPPKAHRWVGEMEEIAATLGSVGLTPRMLEGAADVYGWVAKTPLGRTDPEEHGGQDLDATVTTLAAALTATAEPHAHR